MKHDADVPFSCNPRHGGEAKLQVERECMGRERLRLFTGMEVKKRIRSTCL